MIIVDRGTAPEKKDKFCYFALCMKLIPTFLSTFFFVSAALPHSVADAVRRSDGTISFAQPPFLVAAVTTDQDTDSGSAKYYFTIDLPTTASEPLQRVTIAQTEGTQRIRFEQKQTFAFEGTRARRGPKLALQPTKIDREHVITVTFDPPVLPGKTVTIGLRPVINPRYDGVYLFGVTAFPAGEQTTGQFLGFGRLQFYTDGNT